MSSRLLFKASAITEILIGIALLATPSLVIELLLGDGLGSVGVAAARILGVGLLSVGVAAWETPLREVSFAPRAGLCIYNLGAAALLSVFGAIGGLKGTLLWPTAIIHGLIGAAMLRVLLTSPSISD